MGHTSEVKELEKIAGSAEEAASALSVETGAIVKTLVFKAVKNEKETPVIALVSGDKRCNTKALLLALKIDGKCIRPNADEVKLLTGYSIGGVSPIALPLQLPIFIDEQLNRFDLIWSAAGHPHCVFPSTFEQLQVLTQAETCENLSK